jgi:2-oxoglutarate ferredoxin oxidoreductase subunit alpha
LYVYGLPDHYSRIRGGHNFFSVRISDEPLYCHEEPVHLLLALTAETVPRHRDQIAEGGAIVYDTALDVPEEDLAGDDVRFIGVPMSALAKEVAGTALARNTVALGFAAGLTGFGVAPLQSVIRENFARKGQAVVDGNLAAVEVGYREGLEQAAGFPHVLRSIPDAPPRMAINGTAAFALGALAGGCRFAAGYPMTPGSPVLHWMAAHGERYGVVVKHTEDEIAAINGAIGAAHMGARALVPTSGGGFSLMVEALGLAGMTETPVVIYNAQRPGPATGLPTRQEQGDLLFTLHASQGEFPRFILAATTHEDAFVAGWRSFNLAEKYQTPAIVLSDHYLAVAVRTLDSDAFDFDAVRIERGTQLSRDDLDALQEPYLRYRVMETGVSPRAVPGHPAAVYVASGNEHDERGAITEDPAIRTAQVDKRLRKMAGMAGEMSGPLLYGPTTADTTLVCWGSTYGPAREAVDRLNAGRAGRVNLLCFSDLWPFPTDAVNRSLDATERVVTVELNATGQLATLIRASTSRTPDAQVHKYDGRSFTPDYIVRAFESII